MRRLIASFAILFSLCGVAIAADGSVPTYTAAGAIADTDIMYCAQSAGTVDTKCTPLQLANYIFGKVSGDLTCTSTGGCTVTKTSGVAFGALATVTPGSGVATLLAAASSGTGAPLGGTAPTISSPTLTGTPVAPTATVGTNTTQLATTAFVLANAGSGAVSSVSSGIGVTCTPTTGSVVCSAPATVRNNTATTDTITSTDKGTIVTENNASAVAVAITTTGFVSTDYFTVKNLGVGPATYTPSSGNIDGAGTLVCATGQSSDLYWDGTNLHRLANTCGLGALATVTPGANVATAAAVALSGAGGLTGTIASGTQALGTTLVASAACSSAIIATATNVATTDVVLASFNGDPTAVTGYVPLTTGMLTIIAYPTSGNVNFKYCNNTSASITPGAITLNWRVVR